MKKKKCAFCQGTGKDPFELLSELATCQVCGGKGEIELEDPVVECAFCKGTGVHRNRRLTCTACGGKGVIPFKGEKETCPACDGKGYQKDGNYPCIVCKGKGVVLKSDKGKKKESNE